MTTKICVLCDKCDQVLGDLSDNHEKFRKRCEDHKKRCHPPETPTEEPAKATQMPSAEPKEPEPIPGGEDAKVL